VYTVGECVVSMAFAYSVPLQTSIENLRSGNALSHFSVGGERRSPAPFCTLTTADRLTVKFSLYHIVEIFDRFFSANDTRVGAATLRRKITRVRRVYEFHGGKTFYR